MASVRSCVTLTLFAVLASPRAFGDSASLPLKRLRLYETGVGYFERSGAAARSALTLPVPASHLDDALKTLVVFSGDGSSEVAGVEFGSSVSRPMARALAGFGPEQQRLGLLALLSSLKGANVELRTPGANVTGRLVEVLEAEASDLSVCVRAQGADAKAPCSPAKQPALVVMTPNGELRRFDASEIVSARPTDPAYASRLGAALDALSDGSARSTKELVVLAHAGKTLSIGYVSETPVWRASYRLVLGAKSGDAAALQGWALIHNDTDEPWSKVNVELVNGRPDGFLFPLAAPRYARRELVTPENPLSTVPQLMRTTPDALWNTDDEDGYGAGFGLSGVGEGGGGRGYGVGFGSIGTLGHGEGSGDAASSLLSVGNLAGVAAAEGVEAGALFRYSLGHAVSLRAHGSALVPFVGEGVKARRIALFEETGHGARSGVFLSHTGGQTLPPGTLAVFADGGFAGETALPRLKTKESVALGFGADLDVERKTRGHEQMDETRMLEHADDGLIEHYIRRHKLAEHLENRSGMGCEVFLRLDYVNNAEVKGADELVFDSQKRKAYAVFRLAARSSAERTLEVEEGLSRLHPRATLSRTALERLARSPGLPTLQRKILAETAATLREADVRLATLALRRGELAQREAEVARFREHARGLGSAGESLVERLLQAEDKAEVLRRAVTRLNAEAIALRRRAAKSLARLAA